MKREPLVKMWFNVEWQARGKKWLMIYDLGVFRRVRKEKWWYCKQNLAMNAKLFEYLLVWTHKKTSESWYFGTPINLRSQTNPRLANVQKCGHQEQNANYMHRGGTHFQNLYRFEAVSIFAKAGRSPFEEFQTFQTGQIMRIRPRMEHYHLRHLKGHLSIGGNRNYSHKWLAHYRQARGFFLTEPKWIRTDARFGTEHQPVEP